MRYQDMVTNKKVFCEEVEEDVKPNLADMGIDLVTFNVQSFSDDKGLLDDLGIENTSLIKKEAAKSKAAADQEIAQAQAEADMEIAKTRANAAQATAIAQAEATQKAKEAEIATASAIADKQNELDIKKAKLKAQAEAAKYAAEQEAAGIAAKGKAEAEAIKAKGLAEAEAIEKKAEAQAKMGDASKLEMLYNVLPSVAHELAGTLNGVDNITMYGTDAGSQFVEKTTQGLHSFLSSMTNGGLNLGSITGGIIGSKIAQSNENNENNE